MRSLFKLMQLFVQFLRQDDKVSTHPARLEKPFWRPHNFTPAKEIKISNSFMREKFYESIDKRVWQDAHIAWND